MCSTLEEQCGHTGNHIAGIHSILVFDESETIHELDLGDLPGAMSVEMGLDISLGGWVRSVMFFDRNPNRIEHRKGVCYDDTHHFGGDCPGITWWKRPQSW